MARISSAISGIERSLLDRLAESETQITLSALRMATGHKINAASDDPSAFVTLSRLQTDLSLATKATANVNAAGSMVGQTQSALDQVRTQLNTIRTELLTDENQTRTPAQRAESQAKIDTAIRQIATLSGTTIDGRRTLDGSADFIYTGRNYAQVADVQAHTTPGAGQTISGEVTATATMGYKVYTGDANGATANASFTLTGNRGSISVNVTDDEPLATLAAEVNKYSHRTGIVATVNEATFELTFATVDYGSNATVGIAVSSGTFNTTGSGEGTNAEAVINGRTIAATSASVSGNRFAFNENGLSLAIEFKPGFLGTFDTITVNGSALTYDLATDVVHTAQLSIPGVQPYRLGGPSGTLDQLLTGGTLANLGTNTSQAIRVVDEALGVLTRVEGSVDGFYNAAVESASNLYADLEEQLQDSIDSIDAVDDTEEEIIQAHYEVLAENAISGLAILNQQRLAIVDLIRQAAGLN